MRIYLNDEYRIHIDKFCFVLEKYSKSCWSSLGYYGKIDGLLNAIMMEELAEDGGEYKTIEEIRNSFDSLEEKIDNLGRKCVTIFDREKWYPEFEEKYVDA